jgi:2-hydroxychromene-2-carboxylate isomerase
MRGALFFKEQDQISDYALSIFKAYWTDGKDISHDSVISQISEDLNLDSNVFLNFINQETTKNALKENTQELIDRGGFGSPTYFFKNSMFFGNDRIQLLEEQLKIS